MDPLRPIGHRGEVIATDTVPTDFGEVHYPVVALRDDQVDRIAEAVTERLLAMAQFDAEGRLKAVDEHAGYVIFRRDRLFELLGRVGLPPGLWGKDADEFGPWQYVDSAPIADKLVELVEEYRIHG
jgi:hypothetical protein